MTKYLSNIDTMLAKNNKAAQSKTIDVPDFEDTNSKLESNEHFDQRKVSVAQPPSPTTVSACNS